MVLSLPYNSAAKSVPVLWLPQGVWISDVIAIWSYPFPIIVQPILPRESSLAVIQCNYIRHVMWHTSNKHRVMDGCLYQFVYTSHCKHCKHQSCGHVRNVLLASKLMTYNIGLVLNIHENYVYCCKQCSQLHWNLTVFVITYYQKKRCTCMKSLSRLNKSKFCSGMVDVQVLLTGFKVSFNPIRAMS